MTQAINVRNPPIALFHQHEGIAITPIQFESKNVTAAVTKKCVIVFRQQVREVRDFFRYRTLCHKKF
jgi:hypothetical protein